jgi:hypothetical protein
MSFIINYISTEKEQVEEAMRLLEEKQEKKL